MAQCIVFLACSKVVYVTSLSWINVEKMTVVKLKGPTQCLREYYFFKFRKENDIQTVWHCIIYNRLKVKCFFYT